MLSGCAYIGHDLQEILGAGFRTEATGNLGLDFDHAEITLRLIVVKSAAAKAGSDGFPAHPEAL